MKICICPFCVMSLHRRSIEICQVQINFKGWICCGSIKKMQSTIKALHFFGNGQNFDCKTKN